MLVFYLPQFLLNALFLAAIILRNCNLAVPNLPSLMLPAVFVIWTDFTYYISLSLRLCACRSLSLL